MNMDEVMRERISGMLEEVLASSHSEFYKNKYSDGSAEAFVKRKGKWKDIPFLTRDELEETSVWDRLYTSTGETGLIRGTSGTSGKKIPIVPISYVVKEEYRSPLRRWHTEGVYNTRRAINFGTGCWTEDTFRSELGMNMLALDAGDAKASVNIIKSFKPKHLVGYGYALSAMGEMLKGEDTAKNVKVVRVYGERCSTLQWEALHNNFPNAVILSEYVSIELQRTAGIACEIIAQKKEQYIHPIPESAFVEIVNPDTGEIIKDEDVVGELIVTIFLRALSLPVIRYKTGDAARIVRKKCSCGVDTPVISIEGRLEIDHIRIRGGEISLSEVDRVVTAHAKYLTGNDFELHYNEEKDEKGKIKPAVTIYLQWDESDIAAGKLAHSFEKHMRVAPERTYSNGVEDGTYVHLKVAQLQSDSAFKKKKRIVKDVR